MFDAVNAATGHRSGRTAASPPCSGWLASTAIAQGRSRHAREAWPAQAATFDTLLAADLSMSSRTGRNRGASPWAS
jgi:hypothetical protein